jgi:hypothetical protein
MLWWIGFLISGFLGRIAIPDLGDDPTLEQLKSDSTNSMASDGFDIAVLVLAILVVRVTTPRHEAAADALRQQPYEGAAPLPWAQPAKPAEPAQVAEPAQTPEPAGPERPA